MLTRAGTFSKLDDLLHQIQRTRIIENCASRVFHAGSRQQRFARQDETSLHLNRRTSNVERQLKLYTSTQVRLLFCNSGLKATCLIILCSKTSDFCCHLTRYHGNNISSRGPNQPPPSNIIEKSGKVHAHSTRGFDKLPVGALCIISCPGPNSPVRKIKDSSILSMIETAKTESLIITQRDSPIALACRNISDTR